MTLLVNPIGPAKIDLGTISRKLLSLDSLGTTPANQTTQTTQATQQTESTQTTEAVQTTTTQATQQTESVQTTQATQAVQTTQTTETYNSQNIDHGTDCDNKRVENQSAQPKNYFKIDLDSNSKKQDDNLDSKSKKEKNQSTKDQSEDKSDQKDELLDEIIKKIGGNKSINPQINSESDELDQIDPAKKDEFLAQVASLFDQEQVEELARSSGFVKRKSKLTGHLFMTIFTFGVNIFGSPTQAQLVGLLDLVAQVEMTRQALHNRIKEDAVTFFEDMLSLAINISLPDNISINVLGAFNRVMILDSTSFQLPPGLAKYFVGSGGSASPAGVKIQFAYDLLSSQFVCLIQNGKTPDNRYDNSLVKHIEPGDLTIRDLGYSNTLVFIHLDQKGAYFLGRLKSDLKVYVKNRDHNLEEFDLDKYLSSLMSGNICELEVYLCKDEQHVKVRLVIERLPQEVKESRSRKRKKENQKKGRTASKRTKLREGFNLYISNAPAKMVRFSSSEYELFQNLSPETAQKLDKYTYKRQDHIYIDFQRAVKELKIKIDDKNKKLFRDREVVVLEAKGFRYIYKVRWQIELIFKNWKSNFDLEAIRVKDNEYLAKCLLYAKLLYILISTKITFLAKSLLWKKEQKEVSELQAGQHLKMMALTWMFFSIHAPFLVENMLQRAVKFLMSKCVKSKKKGQLLPLEILKLIHLFI